MPLHHERLGARCQHRGEGAVEILAALELVALEIEAEITSGIIEDAFRRAENFSGQRPAGRRHRQIAHSPRQGHNLAEQLKLFGLDFRAGGIGEPRDVATRAGERFDQAEFDGKAHAIEHDGNFLRRFRRRDRRLDARRPDDVDALAHQVFREGRKAILPPFAGGVLEGDGFTADPAALAQLCEHRIVLSLSGRRRGVGIEKPDDGKPLRACR